MISSRPEGWFFSSYVASHLRNWICRWWTGGSFGGWGSISVGGVLQSVPLRSHSIFFTDDDLGRLGVTYIFWSCYIACEFYSTLPCRLSPLAHLSGQRRSCTDIAAAVIEKKKFSLFCELRPEEGRLVYVKISIWSHVYILLHSSWAFLPLRKHSLPIIFAVIFICRVVLPPCLDSNDPLLLSL